MRLFKPKPKVEKKEESKEGKEKEEVKKIIEQLRKVRKRSVLDNLRDMLVVSFIILLTNYYLFSQNTLTVLAMLLLGSVAFLPIGLVIGWLFLDPYMRAKVYKWIRRKNYGVVNLVGRGKTIISMIKNFDEDVILVGSSMWILEPSRVYRYDKTSESYAINPDNIMYISGVPTIFLDLDTMRPLTFEKEKTPIKPEELGATLKGWVYNQMAKAMFFKRTMEIIFIAILVVSAISGYFAYQTQYYVQQEIPKLHQEIASLKHLLEQRGLIGNVTHVVTQGG